LPLEGERPSSTRVGDHLRPDVPTCVIGEPLGDVAERVAAAGWDTCLVVNEQRIVLGRLGRSALARRENIPVDEAMSAGPSTVRPSYELDRAVARMETQNLTGLPVTRSDGVLLGLLQRRELVQ
jgi:CBS domain-containing protein